MASRTPARPERPSTSRFPAPIQSAGRIAVGVLIAALLLAAIPGGPARDRAEAAFPGRAVDWAPVTTGSPPLNLILLSLDTTRRDHLSCYGFSKPTTPNLDRLAAEGILFEDSFTPVPVTLAAHATMLTGLYPYQHGVRNNGSYVLPAKAVTLAEILKQRGYSTGAVLGAFPLDHRFGLDQGFDSYDDHFPPELRDADTAQRSGAEVSRLALEWLDSHKSGPFFLWAHYFDAHAPYRPIEPFKSRFPGDPYSAEVAAMDAAIGDLMSGLQYSAVTCSGASRAPSSSACRRPVALSATSARPR